MREHIRLISTIRDRLKFSQVFDFSHLFRNEKLNDGNINPFNPSLLK